MGTAGAIAGVFLRPMTEDLGWTAAEFTLGGSAAFLLGGISGFIIGPLVDRHGARPLMLTGACLYAVAFFGMSRVEELWQFIVLSMVAGGAGFSMVGPLVSNVTLSKWFALSSCPGCLARGSKRPPTTRGGGLLAAGQLRPTWR